MKTTKHTCGGPVFGKRTAGCPRCDELAAGAAPVQWAWGTLRRLNAEQASRELKHSCRESGCGPVCTWGDW